MSSNIPDYEVSFEQWMSLNFEDSLDFFDPISSSSSSSRVSNKILPKVITMDDCMSTFNRLGFSVEAGRGKGSHYWLKNKRGCSFALPCRNEVPVKVLQKYIKQSGVSKEEFVSALNI